MTPRPIRILELRSLLGSGGGPEKTILAGAQLADPKRHAVTVCYIRDLRDDKFGMDERARAAGVDYVQILERHSFDVRIWSALRKVIRSRRIHIVHSHDYKTDLYAWLLSKVEPVVPLATLHGYTEGSVRQRLYYMVDKRILRGFPMAITVSEDLRSELIRTGSRPERVVRILNGIDERAFRRCPGSESAARERLGVTAHDVVIGGVGRLEHQKRFDLLMQAFAELSSRRAGDALRLVIAGEGSMRGALEQRRDQLGLNSTCIFAGHQSDVAALYHAFDVFVQSSDYEGTPNAVLEAMALETPIVATDVGGTAELVTDGVHGIIVPPGDAGAIASAIHRTLSDRDTTERRRAAARSRVEQELSFKARMAAVEEIYDRLVDADVSAASEAAEHSR